MIIRQFSLIEHDGCTISLPKNSKVLTIDFLDDHPFIWILLDETQVEQESRTFKILKTNQLIKHRFKSYLSSIKDTNHTDLLHVFEV